ncbi:MAG TPA: M14 family metallopeptidase [Bacteroidales bacterium]|nr:M14 family metallopeptidase [Bacteroidales bacterium]
MKRSLSVLTIFLIYIIMAKSQPSFKTVAESSDFKSTSTYSDVISFIRMLEKSSPFIKTETIAISNEGREIPLLIIGNPLPATPGDLLNDRRVVICIQGNIHAGEVEGKEASLMFARDILLEKNKKMLDNVVFLICPVINPDGNERISKLNRTQQNGPANGVGVRYNAQFLDLNRDGMKVESPEIKGLIMNVFNRWDPAVFMDCHTTNGSYHVEPVTFTWSVNPAGDRMLINYMRDRMMPEISKTLMNSYKVENCFYGEFIDMLQPEKGWILDASEPRYISNYFGIRNRLGILNENYVYADYKSRVLGCYSLIRSLADYASDHAQKIKTMVKEADNRTVARGMNPGTADSFPIKYKLLPAPEKVTVKTYEAELVSVTDGWPEYKKTDRRKDVTVPYYIDYLPALSTAFPFAYILTIPDKSVIELLLTHGVKLEKLSEPSVLDVMSYEITGLKPAERMNQGHYTNFVEGQYTEKKIDCPAGSVIIRTAQPLANIASTLLEPESIDGLVFWNFFDKYLVPQWGSGFNQYPVLKLMRKTDLKTVPF